MKHKFFLIKLDETEYWEHPTLVNSGRIFGLYVADLSQRTHCCEWTPSYELNFVKSQCEFFDEKNYEEIDDCMMEADANSEPVIYMHCTTVDSLPSIDRKKQFFPQQNSGGALFELDGCEDMDEAIEYVKELE